MKNEIKWNRCRFCRPLSEDEMRLHTPVVISCNEGRREVSAVQSIANKQIDRTFAFDKVFCVFLFSLVIVMFFELKIRKCCCKLNGL